MLEGQTIALYNVAPTVKWTKERFLQAFSEHGML